jgi:hypothetical protein
MPWGVVKRHDAWVAINSFILLGFHCSMVHQNIELGCHPPAPKSDIGQT